jgi:hypothetical protein
VERREQIVERGCGEERAEHGEVRGTGNTDIECDVNRCEGGRQNVQGIRKCWMAEGLAKEKGRIE